MKLILRLLFVPILLSLCISAYTQTDPGQDYVIQVRHSNNYLMPKQGSVKSGAKVVQGIGGDAGQRCHSYGLPPCGLLCTIL